MRLVGTWLSPLHFVREQEPVNLARQDLEQCLRNIIEDQRVLGVAHAGR